MLKKFLFTPADVSAFIAALNELPRADFMSSLELLETNFVGWVLHSFELSESQQTYLLQLPLSFQRQAQSLLLLALSQQLDIRLEKDESGKPAAKDSKPGVGKMIGIDFGATAQAAEEAESDELDAGLIFRIWYEPES